MRETTVADFRRSEPSSRRFWRVYAPGTFQNFPVLGRRYLVGKAGRYLFNLTPRPLDARLLPQGAYVVTVSADEIDGHQSSLSERIDVHAVRARTERGIEVRAEGDSANLR